MKAMLRAAILILIGPALAAAESLAASGQPVAMPIDLADKQAPWFREGRLLAFDGDRSVITVFDGSGTQVASRHVEVSGAAKVAVHDVAVSHKGDIALAATVSELQGGSYAALVWLDANGATRRAVRTNPFAALRIAFAASGELRAAGREHLPSYHEAEDYAILRQFDSEGRVVKALLRSSLFGSPKLPVARDSYLTSSADGGVALCLPAVNEWVLLASDGSAVERRPVQLPRGQALTGAVLAPGGKLYVSTLRNGEEMQLHRFRSGRDAPESLQAAGVIPKSGFLFGAQGSDLVFLSNRTLYRVAAR